MDEYDEEEQDSSDEETDPVEEQVEGDVIPRQQYDKVVKEARSLRTKLRRTEFAAEFGTEVVELVPDSLPLKEQRALAEKLKTRLGSTAQTPASTSAESEDTEAAEQPTDQELRAAALSRSGSKSSDSRLMSIEDWQTLAQSDPAAAQAAFQAERVNFSGLREGLGAAK